MTKQRVEVEGGELAIRNSHGDIAIIPKYDRDKVQKMIDAGCNTCIDRYVAKLPRMNNYAADGTFIENDKPNNPPISNKSKRNKIVVFAESKVTDYTIPQMLSNFYINQSDVEKAYNDIKNLSDDKKEILKGLIDKRNKAIRTNIELEKRIKEFDELYQNAYDIVDKYNLYELEEFSEIDPYALMTNNVNIEDELSKIQNGIIKDKISLYYNEISPVLTKLSELNNVIETYNEKITDYNDSVINFDKSLSKDEIQNTMYSYEDDSFQQEASKLKRYYKGDKDIEIVPLYNDINKFDSIVSSLNKDDKVIIMGHSGRKLMGIDNSVLGESLSNCNANDLYLGTCNGDKRYEQFKDSNMNIKYRPHSSWLGINPTGNTLDELMFGNLNEEVTNDIELGKHYDQYLKAGFNEVAPKKDEIENDKPIIGPTILNENVNVNRFNNYIDELNKLQTIN